MALKVVFSLFVLDTERALDVYNVSAGRPLYSTAKTSDNVFFFLKQLLGPMLTYVRSKDEQLESALCGDANPRRLQRQSCCG